MSKRRKSLWLTISTGLILGAVFLVRALFPDPAAGAKVDEEIRRLKAAGEPVSVADLIGPKVPDSQNAAIIYDKIFKRLSKAESRGDDRLFSEFANRTKRAVDPSLWVKARAASARYAGILPLLDEAAALPQCNFRVSWTGSWKQEIKYYDNLRSLGRIVGAFAILSAKDGRMDKAIHLMELSFRVSESLKDEPTVMGQLSRLSIDAIAAARLKELCEDYRITESQASRLNRAIARIELHLGVRKAIRGERATGISYYDEIRVTMAPRLPRNGIVSAAIAYRLLEGLYSNELYLLRYMRICDDASDVPYRELRNRHTDMPKPPKDDFLAYDINLYGIYKSRDHGIADLGGSRILLALKTYKSRYASYPQNLGQCRQKLGWKLPEDPFSGRDFVYRRQGDGFLLYSIGPNLKDDGGKASAAVRAATTSKGRARPVPYTDDYDLVWKLTN